MRHILDSQSVKIPKNVTIDVESRVVTVKGPKGTLVRDFKHMNVTIEKTGKHTVRVDLWYGDKKAAAGVRTVCSHIKNLIIGVTKGFKYQVRLAYAHFPINTVLDPKQIEIRNFLGERRTRYLSLPAGVTVARTADVKDQLEFSGNSIEDVSHTAALLHHKCMVRNKDIRKFLDGAYVSAKGPSNKVRAI